MAIIEVGNLTNGNMMDKFFQVAHRVYEHDPVWVPENSQSIMGRLQAMVQEGSTRVFPVLALKEGIPVARAAAIASSKAVDSHGSPEGWIGFFEALETYENEAASLLERCQHLLVRQGVRAIVAPKVDNLSAGLLVKGFHLPQTVMTSHNPNYYYNIFMEAGYTVFKRMLTYYFDRDRVRKLSIKIPGCTTRELDISNPERELSIFNGLQNSIFGQANGYIQRSLDQDRALFQSLRGILDPQLVIFAEDSRGRPAGLLICIPDANQCIKEGKIDRARIVSIGVLPGFARKGYGAAMCSHLIKNLIQKGYACAEASWVLEDNNAPKNLIKRFNALDGREFVLMKKTLEY